MEGPKSVGLRMGGRRIGILTDTGLALWPGGIRNRTRVRTRRTSTWTFGLGNLDFWTWMTGAPGLMAGELGPFSPCGLGRLGLLPRLAGPCQADSDCGLGLRRSHSAPVTVDSVDSCAGGGWTRRTTRTVTRTMGSDSPNVRVRVRGRGV